MNTTKFRTFFANAVCGTIPGKQRRDIVRIKIKYHKYLRDCKKFALAHSGGGRHKIRIMVGERGHNLVLIVDKLYAFKFPLHYNGHDKALREYRIVDAFAKISPIKIPKMELFQWGDITVRRYEYISGKLIKQISPKIVLENRDKIASQLANFIFTISISDPESIRDLKPQPDISPAFMYGWCHNDIPENFIVNPHTLDIEYFIDWEDTQFCDFKMAEFYAKRNWDRYGFQGLAEMIEQKYTQLYKKYSKQD